MDIPSLVGKQCDARGMQGACEIRIHQAVAIEGDSPGPQAFFTDLETMCWSCALITVRYINHQSSTRLDGHLGWFIHILIESISSTRAAEEWRLHPELMSQIWERFGRYSWTSSNSAHCLFLFSLLELDSLLLQDTGTELPPAIRISSSHCTEFRNEAWRNFVSARI